MGTIKESLQILIETVEHRHRINEFAKNRYKEKFVDQNKKEGWHHYESFDIIDENTIKVKYKYGIGEMEFNDSFLVTID